jgi:hypothetical protein
MGFDTTLEAVDDVLQWGQRIEDGLAILGANPVIQEQVHDFP